MIDCPTHGPVDGLFCGRCGPRTPKREPIPAAAREKIDRILGRNPKPIDREEREERAAIQDEGW